jgi:hypothetical protein
MYKYRQIVLFSTGEAYGWSGTNKFTSIKMRNFCEIIGTDYTMERLKKEFPNTSKRYSNDRNIAKWERVHMKIAYRKEIIFNLLKE